jgi:hypothetical protein
VLPTCRQKLKRVPKHAQCHALTLTSRTLKPLKQMGAVIILPGSSTVLQR